VKETKNFLPEQYKKNNKLPINHNYLSDQFSDYQDIFKKISKTIKTGDYTLGTPVDILEKKFAKLCNTKHAIGVGSGTDALFLSLKALDIGPGDEVITPAFTFYATVGAIVTAGATPKFADISEDFNIDVDKIESLISKKTKAIMPVHWSGKPCEMDKINAIAKKHNLFVIEDACHAITATYKNMKAGSLGTAGCFSFHPLKNLNVWGDGGIITTNSDKLDKKLRLLRNHGLSDRNTCEVFAYNSRLDTIQAVVATHMLKKLTRITNSRIKNAKFYDEYLKEIPEITIPARSSAIKQVFHLYMIVCENRDELQKFLISHGIDAKIHYPTPLHLQPAAKQYNYKKGDFPISEKITKNVLSLPVHEFITLEQKIKVIKLIKKFYSKL